MLKKWVCCLGNLIWNWQIVQTRLSHAGEMARAIFSQWTLEFLASLSAPSSPTGCEALGYFSLWLYMKANYRGSCFCLFCLYHKKYLLQMHFSGYCLGAHKRIAMMGTDCLLLFGGTIETNGTDYCTFWNIICDPNNFLNYRMYSKYKTMFSRYRYLLMNNKIHIHVPIPSWNGTVTFP